SGVLTLCFGEATKFSQYLLDSDKVYRVTALLGVTTDSGDAEGLVTRTCSVPAWPVSHIESALAPFRGTFQQVPPMFSALKHKGQPLYKLARQGITVHRGAREITVRQLTLLQWEPPKLTLEVAVSKGTYVRTLIEDIGRALGVGGHVLALRRLQAGSFLLSQTVSVAQLTALAEQEGPEALDRCLQPIGSAVSHWPKALLSRESTIKLLQGQAVVPIEVSGDDWVQIHHVLDDHGSQDGFVGVGEVLADGRVAPRRLVRSA
ncbi:MAG: tRNA pseudouridine(55) synthase TruB, partial [Gammaproteobacteria bacterium]